MGFNHTLASLASAPWALAEDHAGILHDLIRAEAQGVDVQARLRAAAADGDFRNASASQASIAVIPVAGMITQRMNWFGTSTEWISARLQMAVADPSCRAVILVVDSGGGTVAGTPELADEIFRARSRKPIIALVSSLAASAAYWIASQASEIVVIPSGSVGSIGVFVMHLDMSGALSQAGLKPTFIFAGKHKVDGNPYEPPSGHFLKREQTKIDSIYGDFLRAVARGRGVSVAKVQADFGQGDCLLARDAVSAGMADRVGTMPDAIARAGKLAAAGGSSARALGVALGTHLTAKQREQRAVIEAVRRDVDRGSQRARRLRMLKLS